MARSSQEEAFGFSGRRGGAASRGVLSEGLRRRFSGLRAARIAD
jgi:hypothetical protein